MCSRRSNSLFSSPTWTHQHSWTSLPLLQGVNDIGHAYIHYSHEHTSPPGPLCLSYKGLMTPAKLTVTTSTVLNTLGHLTSLSLLQGVNNISQTYSHYSYKHTRPPGPLSLSYKGLTTLARLTVTTSTVLNTLGHLTSLSLVQGVNDLSQTYSDYSPEALLVWSQCTCDRQIYLARCYMTILNTTSPFHN